MHDNLLQEVRRIVESDGRPEGTGIVRLARGEDGGVRIGYAGMPETRLFRQIRDAFDLAAYETDMFPAIPPFVFEDVGVPGVERVTVQWPSLNLVVLEVQPDFEQWSPPASIEDIERSVGATPAEVVDAIAALRLPCWALGMDESAPAPARGSRWFGPAWVPAGSRPPIGSDGRSMSLLVQIDLAEMPEEVQDFAGGEGLVALYVSLGGADAVALRLNTTEGSLASDEIRPGAAVRLDGPHVDHMHVEDVLLSGFDLPRWVRSAAGAQLLPPGGGRRRRPGEAATEADVAEHVEDFQRVFGVRDDERARAYADLANLVGDKVGGWPAWERGGDWPDGDSGSYRLLMQIDGSWGIGQVQGAMMVLVDVRTGALVVRRPGE